MSQDITTRDSVLGLGRPLGPGIRIRDDAQTRAIRLISVILVSLMALACVIPFIILVSGSFTSQNYLIRHGFSLLPRDSTLIAYEFVFMQPKQVLGNYIVTILMTAIGTGVGLMIITMTAYCLQRPDFVIRNHISFYIYFTTLFSGGLIPYYLVMTNVLGLKNNYLAVLLPSLMSPWLIILMKSFIASSVPHSITESALIDGASDFRIFRSIILPVSAPGLATVGLFLALGYWNEWYNTMLFLDNTVDYKPLQYFLYDVMNRKAFLQNSAVASNVQVSDLPGDNLKLAVAVVSTGPIIFVYPFVQRFFIRGITVGAVKG